MKILHKMTRDAYLLTRYIELSRPQNILKKFSRNTFPLWSSSPNLTPASFSFSEAQIISPLPFNLKKSSLVSKKISLPAKKISFCIKGLSVFNLNPPREIFLTQPRMNGAVGEVRTEIFVSRLILGLSRLSF